MVTVLMPGQSDETACVRISAALSEVTKQKLGFSVSIEQVAPTNYSAELWKRMVCQTMPDLFFLTEDQPLDVYLNQNCILPLSALLEEYPGLKALFSEQQWASRTYYRRIYAVPARAVSMYQIGFLARADWMRELGVRPEKITDLDALHDLLMQVRQRLWGDRIFEKCGIRRDEGGDGGKTLEIRGKRRLSARDGGANYQQS